MAVRALLSYVVLHGPLRVRDQRRASSSSCARASACSAGSARSAWPWRPSRAPREHTGRAVGSIQSAQILSAAVGPLTGGLLADLIGIRWTFLVAAAACAVALGLLLAYYEERAAAGRRRPGTAAAGRCPPILRLPTWRRCWWSCSS